MILCISAAFFLLGIWLLYLNRIYVGVSPVFQSGFVCFLAALLIVAGDWSNGFNAELPQPLAIVFPLYLLFLFGFIIYEIPTYTYKGACQLIEEETGHKIIYQKYAPLCDNGTYFCYTDKGYYSFDPTTGEYTNHLGDWSFE